ncbi:Luc7-related protein [Dioscorea alata]|uniref:Luc7-related protein n=6 Tax=Dioscorea alata TaxID=55571 RepID=A0ACB7WW42_DIOAL|nr:Luc7-related protein [Dioscorea alata]KAH7692735.1 Luc7-related protein [Dioscorea alata]KAH7692736.1 Luc7-related protein [Dioscorea alata]KAH7692737.1 Luc7-related protein [Dioscorea alata]KAH7692738.1 Luc7-related protein [Dioscorea alata]
MDAQRALLDELMGSARNLTEEEKKGYREMRWDDKEVCGPFMLKFCPHDLFVNTKSDLGPCPKIHDLKLKESFEKSPRHDAYVPKFEAELAQFCEKLVTNLNRKVKRGQERVAQDDVQPTVPITSEKSGQLLLVEERIKKLLEQIESLGEAGKVDEAEALMRMVDSLNAQKTGLMAQASDKGLPQTQEKKIALCEICGSFLVANDAAERTQSHVTGKQHVGYSMVRDFLSEYKAAKDKAREEERLTKEKEVEERRKQRERKNEERDRGHDRHREREFDRERSREWGGKSSRDGGRGFDGRSNHNRNGRDRDRDKDRFRDRNGDMTRDRARGRSRSRSPARHVYRRSSRSPVRPY